METHPFVLVHELFAPYHWQFRKSASPKTRADGVPEWNESAFASTAEIAARKAPQKNPCKDFSKGKTPLLTRADTHEVSSETQ